jgi:shikimate kinase
VSTGTPARLLLVGMMGAGKTTIGRMVADRLGWPYFDSDAEVEAKTGRTVPEIFAADGEQAFRALETEVLRGALQQDHVVVSVAGGVVLDPANRALLRKSGTVVWLRARVSTLARRVGDGAGRPLLGDDPSAALEDLWEVRRPLYAEVADTVIDVDAERPEEISGRLVEMMSPSTTDVGGEPG